MTNEYTYSRFEIPPMAWETMGKEKGTYAKSDCGAGTDDSHGFQPGNTCAGEGGETDTGDKDRPQPADGPKESGIDKLSREPIRFGSPEYREGLNKWMGGSHEYTFEQETGEPKLFLHGSQYEKEDFELDAKLGDAGIWLSTDYMTAMSYAQHDPNDPFSSPKEGKVYITHLRMVDPLIIDAGGHSDSGVVSWDDIPIEALPSQWRDDIFRHAYQSALEFEYGAGEKWTDEEVKEWISDQDNVLRTKEIAAWARDNGFDGVVFKNTWDMGNEIGGEISQSYGDSIVVFDPKQIKSAHENSGYFDPDDSKIRNAKGTYAKEDWPFGLDVGYEELSVAPYEDALELFIDRVPMLKSNATLITRMAEALARAITEAEKTGITTKLDAQSNKITKALDTAFWASDVDRGVIVDLKKLLAESIRGVMPDERITLPEFIDRAWLEGATDLTAARLETVFRTNLGSAYNEGHMASMRAPEVKDIAPLVMIMEIEDDRSRDHHAAMDGYINTVDYIDRLSIAPPNGYNCRGTVRAITWTEAEDLGLVKDEEIDEKALKRYNGDRQGYIDRGEYPDPGFRLR